MRLAVRRGHKLLGEIEIEEVLPDSSVAHLIGRWKGDPKMEKPQAGDDVIPARPF